MVEEKQRQLQDLTDERKKASFDTEALGSFLWGGRQNLKRRREIFKYYEEHEELHDPYPISFMSRMEKIENAYRKAMHFEEHLRKACDINNSEEVRYFYWLVYHLDGYPTNVHYVMGLPTIINMSDEEQQQRWLEPARRREFLATYAQTELGHGTNLKKLETTAIYDSKTEEFVLNSPTVTSLKWWPGNLGHSHNVAIVIAQLWSNGKCYGPHPFFLQIRDQKTHKPLPGITVGDIGPKFGLNTQDNGFLKLNNVRIPRKNMFMKHAKVLHDGTYVPPIHDKIGYTSMMFVRAVILVLMGEYLSIGSTIAIRYSVIRRQGEIKAGKGEVKILDYQTQQYRLFPQLARGIAFILAGRKTFKYCMKTLEDIRQNGDVSLLPDLHAILCGLKAVTTFQTELGLEQCRMSCGGHGYSEASGFPLLNSVQFGGVTYEGENMVMLLQVGRYLMKFAQEIRTGKTCTNPSEICAYFFNNGPKTCLIDQSYDPNYKNILESFEHLSKRLTLQAYDRLEQLKQCGRTPEEAWNECAVQLCKAAKAHIRTFLCRTFVKEIEQIKDLSLLTVLKDLLQLYLFYELKDCATGLLEDGFMIGQQLVYIRNEIYDALTKIRPNSVSIVDSFDFTDRDLNSVLGRKDGHVYENLLKWAQNSPLNKNDVLPFHHKYLGKMREEARLKSHL